MTARRVRKFRIAHAPVVLLVVAVLFIAAPVESQDLALVGVHIPARDVLGWEAVATNLYMEDDLMGALDAWNQRGEPRIDTVDVHGTERTRDSVVVRSSGLKPKEMLTAERFAHAMRRLRDLPVASKARMRFEPLDAGGAEVDVFIDERRVMPRGMTTLAVHGVRALFLNEVKVDIAGALGAGELASASWRWSPNRPRLMLGLAVPSPRWLPGIVSVNGSWERETYDTTPSLIDATPVPEERRRVGLRLADWSTSWLHWKTAATLDHLRAHDNLDPDRFSAATYLGLEGTLNVRLADDRVAFTASGGWWRPFAGRDRFTTGSLLAAWRSSSDASRPFISALAEIGVASPLAPLALWHGAGTGQGRIGLLRAHPLFSTGILTGPVFGRQAANSSVEYVRPIRRTQAGGLSIAAFADTARASRRLNGLGTSAIYVDAGVGLRVNAPGAGGAIRLDLARGLRDGGTALSFGWGGSWPH